MEMSDAVVSTAALADRHQLTLTISIIPHMGV
jgi:hypothetical protein